MKDGLAVLAIVPARGGSDRVPYLNIKRLGDRALLVYSLDAAKAARSIDRIFVSSEDARVREVARTQDVDVLERPAEIGRAHV